MILAVADRWGVISRADSKAVWCELATGLEAHNEHPRNPRVAQVEMSISATARLRTPRRKW